MSRRISSSQLRSKVRQAVQKQKQAIDNYNRAARNYNRQVNQAIDRYNQAARSHNARVRANRERIRRELQKLQRHPPTITTTRYVIFRASVQTLHQAYVRLEEQVDDQYLDPNHALILDLSEREAANSLEVLNTLLSGQGTDEAAPPDDLQTVKLLDELRHISPDLDARWRGAVFALNPHNPDASRHFCTSAREIFTHIFESKAPDALVLTTLPGCDKTEKGKPTRRAKIQYFLHCKGITDNALEEFVEQDMANIIELFRVFNDGTHGTAGRFNFSQLSAFKKRAEEGILFLSQLVN
jgi:hypothetical protein